MSIQKITQAKAEIAATSAYKIITEFFDEGSFIEIDTYAKSGDNYAEAVAGYGSVNGLPCYAFCQNIDVANGAMSKAQAAKLKKVYELALKNGAPIVAIYDSLGGKLKEGNELLTAYGTVLNSASTLSGVVPQISVVLSDCVGTSAITAVSADFVIKVKDAKLSISPSDDGCLCSVAKVAEDKNEAVSAAKELLLYLPSNNLSTAPSAEEIPEDTNAKCVVGKTVDENSFTKLYDHIGKTAKVGFARIQGEVVGIVKAEGGKIEKSDSKKITKLVSFCDAFSIPVLTFIDSEGFTGLGVATTVTNAYAEATTAKISVITGKAVGPVYIAMAGAGAMTDLTLALPEAVVSPLNEMAAAYILAPEKMEVPVAEQEAAASKFVKENLSAFKAAEDGVIENIVTEQELRTVLGQALTMLESKRVNTLPKKHSTIG
ncbi:MAG: carboxyl transferase [Ruminococcus sp.]|nr:carboxyl transferase [Ruminococcus sp.]